MPNHSPPKRNKILVVDDDPTFNTILGDILAEWYDVSTADSGQSCLDQVPSLCPEIILLDIDMPDLSGLEVCQQLKNNPLTAKIPVIFVSGLCSTEERLKGYDVGCEDYVTKPVDFDDLLHKIYQAISFREHDFQLEKMNSAATGTANQAMTNNSELGYIIEFLKACFKIDNLDSFAMAIFAICGRFGLRASLLIRDGDRNFISGCEENSLEARVLEKFMNQNRIFDFGSRTVINDEQITILIKNMPLNDPNRYGRLKDNLMIMIAAASAKLETIFDIIAPTPLDAVKFDSPEPVAPQTNETPTTKAEIETVKPITKLKESAVSKILKKVDQENIDLFSDKMLEQLDELELSFLNIHIEDDNQEVLTSAISSLEEIDPICRSIFLDTLLQYTYSVMDVIGCLQKDEIPLNEKTSDIVLMMLDVFRKCADDVTRQRNLDTDSLEEFIDIIEEFVEAPSLDDMGPIHKVLIKCRNSEFI